jgi:hypothetical protein
LLHCKHPDVSIWAGWKDGECGGRTGTTAGVEDFLPAAPVQSPPETATVLKKSPRNRTAVLRTRSRNAAAGGNVAGSNKFVAAMQTGWLQEIEMPSLLPDRTRKTSAK